MHTDNQPLQTIFERPLAPKRLQRLIMRLQQFYVNVVYKKGTSLVLADIFSDAPLPQVMTSIQPLLNITSGDREK